MGHRIPSVAADAPASRWARHSKRSYSMVTADRTPVDTLTTFANTPLTDFSQEENAQAQREALRLVTAELGTTFPLIIGGERHMTTDTSLPLSPPPPPPRPPKSPPAPPGRPPPRPTRRSRRPGAPSRPGNTPLPPSAPATSSRRRGCCASGASTSTLS